MQVKIATWNVNSIRARLDNLVIWLKSANPDIVLLQELKCQEGDFPLEAISDLGYNVAMSCQKSYNGVAILSKFRIEEVNKNLPHNGDLDDSQARYIEAIIAVNHQTIRIACVYIPNGGGEIFDGQNVTDTEKFKYKLNFFDNLYNHFKNLRQYDEIAFFGGDFNVAIEEIDVYNPKALENTICFHIEERKKMRSILNLGLIDVTRAFNPDSQYFTWWDYRGGSWQYNKGLRIDYILASPKAADKIISTFIYDKDTRPLKKASDHCPLLLTIDI
jgi:exodeoxyribonuclease-3